jgi:adenylate kinase family enzyme
MVLQKMGMSVGRRILVIGPPGSGKSWLSTVLSTAIHIPVYHLDRLYWKPGWVRASPPEVREGLGKLLSLEEWVLDGNYHDTLAERVNVADTIILLDVGRFRCILNVIARVVQKRRVTRDDIPDGSPERLDISFLRWIWNYDRDIKPVTERLLAEARRTRRVIVLRTRPEMREFLSPGAT